MVSMHQRGGSLSFQCSAALRGCKGASWAQHALLGEAVLLRRIALRLHAPRTHPARTPTATHPPAPPLAGAEIRDLLQLNNAAAQQAVFEVRRRLYENT